MKRLSLAAGKPVSVWGPKSLLNNGRFFAQLEHEMLLFLC
jgi:hypothetical protein